MQDNLSIVPTGRQVEGTFVAAYGVVIVVDERGIGGKRIGHIGVNGFTVPVYLPVARHFEIIPGTDIVALLVKIDRTVGGFGYPFELPGSIQGQVIGRRGILVIQRLSGRFIRKCRGPRVVVVD